MKSLAKDTAIYGLSSILGRFLNWCMVPLHMYIFTDTAEYGKLSSIYGYTALFMVLLTYGMETGFFRFMNKEGENPDKVYSTSMLSLAFTSILFIFFCFIFINPISARLEYANHDHILMMVVVVAIDAFMCIPYAYLRYQKRPVWFMSIRISFILINIFFNIFFLLICPWIYKSHPDLISWFYNPGYGIGYIFLANLIGTICVFFMFIPQYRKIKFEFEWSLLKRMLKYSYPLLILGIAGVINQTIAQLVYPHLFDDKEFAYGQLGIYSACIKLSVVITMFTQAFRYAYEPFVFARNKESGDRKPYAEAMKYFVIFALAVFLAVIFYAELLTYIERYKNYTVGLNILPVAMLGEIFFGIYFNLSIWYKLIDKTKYGAVFSILGCIITVAINIIFVPIYGYIASAWATFFCNLIIMAISYFYGQKYFPITYNLKTIFLYFFIALVLYTAGMYIEIENEYLKYGFRTLLLLTFIFIIIKRDLPLREIPIINKLFNKNK